MSEFTREDVLNGFRTLGANWDGYGARAILPSAIDLARELVSLMDSLLPEEARASLTLIPVRHGGVQIEWADADGDHELGVEPDGSLEFMHIDKLTGQMVERKYPSAGQAVHSGVLRELRAMNESVISIGK